MKHPRQPQASNSEVVNSVYSQHGKQFEPKLLLEVSVAGQVYFIGWYKLQTAYSVKGRYICYHQSLDRMSFGFQIGF